jgi:hypothetical protein
MADLQAAIRKADRVKQTVQTQGQLEELRRQRQMRREARKVMLQHMWRVPSLNQQALF